MWSHSELELHRFWPRIWKTQGRKDLPEMKPQKRTELPWHQGQTQKEPRAQERRVRGHKTRSKCPQIPGAAVSPQSQINPRKDLLRIPGPFRTQGQGD